MVHNTLSNYCFYSFIFAFTKGKGIIGEFRVSKILKKCALEFGGIELHDFMFRDERSSSQIDNMLLTQKALYVIEVKNYQGYIFGNEVNDEWTVTVKHVNTKKTKSGRRYNKVHISKHRFYNPIKQNIRSAIWKKLIKNFLIYLKKSKYI